MPEVEIQRWLMLRGGWGWWEGAVGGEGGDYGLVMG